MKTASAVVATIVTMMAIDGQWAAAAVVAVCTAGAFVGSVSTKWTLSISRT
jgi:hypothetical protein